MDNKRVFPLEAVFITPLLSTCIFLLFLPLIDLKEDNLVLSVLVIPFFGILFHFLLLYGLGAANKKQHFASSFVCTYIFISFLSFPVLISAFFLIHALGIVTMIGMLVSPWVYAWCQARFLKALTESAFSLSRDNRKGNLEKVYSNYKTASILFSYLFTPYLVSQTILYQYLVTNTLAYWINASVAYLIFLLMASILFSIKINDVFYEDEIIV